MAQATEQLTISSTTAESEVKSAGRLRELDGWRAISVALVILHHVFSIQHSQRILRIHLVWHIAGMAGFLGVDTFFVISGFVICRLLILEEIRYGAVSLKGFYCRRIFRILPPLYLYLACIAVLLSAGIIQAPWMSLATAAAFLSDMNIFRVSWFVGHTWSLAVEEQFYLIFPTTWVLTHPRRRGLVFGAVYVICLIWDLNLAGSKLALPLFDARTRVGFTCVCFGVIMATHEEYLKRLCSRVPGWMILLAAAALFIHPVPHGVVNEAIFAAIFMPPAIGITLMYTLQRESWVKAALCTRPLQAIGLTSYGIYLWQQLCTGPLDVYQRAGTLAPLFLFMSSLMVPLSYFWVEKPAMRLGKSLSRTVRSRTTMARVYPIKTCE